MEQALNWNDCLAHVELTDVGMRRANNQDSYAALLATDLESWQKRGHVFVVADGMGAHAAGELASKMAADGIPHNYYKMRDESAPDAIRKTIRQVNEEIHRRGQANAEFHGMGTTACTLILLPQGALLAHVGDSRIYRLRGGRFEQLTFDHSLLWEMTASGQYAKDSLPNLVPKNIITRSLGPHKNVQVDLEGPFPLEVGDTFLLCSDGLSGQVKDEEIGAILTALPPAEAAQVLIDLGDILRGGPDNITVVVVRITGSAPSPTQANAGAEPLALAGRKSTEPAGPPPVNKVLWGGAILSIVAAVGLSQIGWMYAVAAAMIAVARDHLGRAAAIHRRGRDALSRSRGCGSGRGSLFRESIARQIKRSFTISNCFETNCAKPPTTAAGRSIGRDSTPTIRRAKRRLSAPARLSSQRSANSAAPSGCMINELRNQGRKRPTPDSE